MSTRVTLCAAVNIDFLNRVPAFALRQLATADERMPVAIQFKLEGQAWPKEQLEVHCDTGEDVIAFVREMAKDELTRRGESIVETPPGAPR